LSRWQVQVLYPHGVSREAITSTSYSSRYCTCNSTSNSDGSTASSVTLELPQQAKPCYLYLVASLDKEAVLSILLTPHSHKGRAPYVAFAFVDPDAIKFVQRLPKCSLWQQGIIIIIGLKSFKACLFSLTFKLQVPAKGRWASLICSRELEKPAYCLYSVHFMTLYSLCYDGTSTCS
jgi:hypothetical protein